MSERRAAARSVLVAMPVIMRAIGREMRAAGCACSPSQYRLLAALARRPRTLGRIARIQGVTPATATTLVTTLESRGWVTRKHDTDDRRRVMVTLTDSGVAVLEQTTVVAERALVDLFEPLDKTDLVELNRAMSALTALSSDARTERAASE